MDCAPMPPGQMDCLESGRFVPSRAHSNYGHADLRYVHFSSLFQYDGAFRVLDMVVHFLGDYYWLARNVGTPNRHQKYVKLRQPERGDFFV